MALVSRQTVGDVAYDLQRFLQVRVHSTALEYDPCTRKLSLYLILEGAATPYIVPLPKTYQRYEGIETVLKELEIQYPELLI